MTTVSMYVCLKQCVSFLLSPMTQKEIHGRSLTGKLLSLLFLFWASSCLRFHHCPPSSSSHAAELEVGKREKIQNFVQKSIFYGDLFKKIKKKN